MTSEANDDDLTALHLAARIGDCTEIRRLLALDADITVVESRDFTPLDYAAYFGKRNAVQLLVEAGADITRINRNGDTAIGLSRACGHRKLTKYLEQTLIKRRHGLD